MLDKLRKLIAEQEAKSRDGMMAIAAECLRLRCHLPLRKIAEGVGKKKDWVADLIRWAKSDYRDRSPFDFNHAKRKKRHTAASAAVPFKSREQIEAERLAQWRGNVVPVSPSGKPRNRSAPNAEHSARALQRFRKSVAHDLSRMLLADLDQAEAWFAEAIEVARRAARERDPLIKAQRSPRLAAVRAA
jgi:hypothetical protein